MPVAAAAVWVCAVPVKPRSRPTGGASVSECPLRRDIKEMKQVRDTQRSRRVRSDVPSIAIVGYTNAGKSSLLNALTGAGVLVQDALFATLEPTTRRGQFDDGRPFVVSDTVGFVRHLPTQLVEAFRSTLEEVVDADLLVHVVDGSNVNPLAQISAVRQVISEVFADYDSGPAPELIVVNKTDAASGLGLAKLRRALPVQCSSRPVPATASTRCVAEWPSWQHRLTPPSTS